MVIFHSYVSLPEGICHTCQHHETIPSDSPSSRPRLRSKLRRPSRAMAPHPNVPDCEAPAANPMPFLPPTGHGSTKYPSMVILGTVYGIGFVYWFTTLQAIPFIIGLHEDWISWIESQNFKATYYIYIYVVHLRMVSCVNVLAKKRTHRCFTANRVTPREKSAMW